MTFRDVGSDVIELWVTVGLREGEEIPVVNGVELASAIEQLEAKLGLEQMSGLVILEYCEKGLSYCDTWDIRV